MVRRDLTPDLSAMSSKAKPDGAREKAYFGDREVGTAEKAPLVHGVFSSVAARYDLMNDLLSGGLHRLWKASLIDSLAPRPGMHLLDVAGGTGDVAFRFLAAAGEGASVTVLDINEAMLRVGEARAARRRRPGGIDFVCGDAEALPLPGRAVDAYTVAFGIRNVTDMNKALAEAHRVLRFGGHFLCLEFCPQTALALLDRLYAAYSDRVIPQLGQWIAGDADSYRYLVQSIRRFPAPDAFAARIKAAGFSRVSHRSLSGGICAIHSAWKI